MQGSRMDFYKWHQMIQLHHDVDRKLPLDIYVKQVYVRLCDIYNW